MSRMKKCDGIEPNFSIKSKFYCPISPYILWHHNLVFKECPMLEKDRDMPSCKRCIFGENISKKYRKNTQKVVKRNKENVPKIGKTYNSK